jgi:dCMP deaminase
MELAKVALLRSEDPHKKVGACVLGHNNEVLAVAYHGLASSVNVHYSFWKDRDERRPFMIHAESNLLSLFTRNQCKLIAVTLLPCTSCARLICAWNIEKVIYCDEYENSDAKYSKEIFNFYNIELKKID